MGVGRVSDAKGGGDVFVVYFACGFMSFAKYRTGGVAFRLCLTFLSGGQVFGLQALCGGYACRSTGRGFAVIIWAG